MAESLTEFLEREYDYLRGREGRDFFLAIVPYAEALTSKRRIRRVLKHLERETTRALERHVEEQNKLIEEAKRIRRELANRAPEIDNSDIGRPDPASQAWMQYDLDSFARFDELANADMSIPFPSLPDDTADPGPLSQLLGILRGRLRAAEYGEDAASSARRSRDDLGDLRRQVGNLGERHGYALRRYRQEGRTLPGLGFGRLVYFGSDLNPEPTIVETDEDLDFWLERTLREWGTPTRIVRKLVNAERMDDWERNSAMKIEQTLEAELDRLHQELSRRVAAGPKAIFRWLRHEPLVVGIIAGVVATVIATLILFYGFGIGDGTGEEPTTVNMTTTSAPRP